MKERSISKKAILYFFVILGLLALLVIPLVYAKPDNSFVTVGRKAVGPVFYAVTLALSLGIFIGYAGFTKRKYIWVLLALASVCFANTGYFALSLSNNVSEALLSNRIAYFGNVYMLLFLIVTVANAGGIRVQKPVIALLFAISTIMFLFSATQGYLDLFYRNADFAIVNGYAEIVKEYGPMHTAYSVYILAYLLIMIITVILAVRRKSYTGSHILLISIIGVVNVLIWVLEKFIPHEIEFLSLSYVLNEGILLIIYRRLVITGALDDYTLSVRLRPEESEEREPVLVVQNMNEDELLGQGRSVNTAEFSPERLRQIICRLPQEKQLTEREIEVAILLLQNMKRKEIAEKLCVSEETVKTHTSHIYGKLSVDSKKSLREKAEALAVKASSS